EGRTEERAERINQLKVPAAGGYPPPLYPAALSPGRTCELAGSEGGVPLYGGEAFGDITWVDVTNLRT
ncbi:unnamed protein product, partial [Prorocentrum cordatum]